jgi:hypothetical protein
VTEARHPLWHALAFGVAAGAAGAIWIHHDYERKAYNLGYHVPLAIVFTSALVDATFDAWRTRRYGFHWAVALAGALIAGRIVEDWPISGHGILGIIMLVSPIRPVFRVAGVLIALQALVTKVIVGEPWPDALWGAAAGAVIGMVGRALDAKRGNHGAPVVKSVHDP